MLTFTLLISIILLFHLFIYLYSLSYQSSYLLIYLFIKIFIYLFIYLYIYLFTDSQVQNIEIRVAPSVSSLGDTGSVCYYRSGSATTRPETFTCNSPLVGRYVKISQLTSSGFFCFCELEVHGY